jgi:hypothetical protein
MKERLEVAEKSLLLSIPYLIVLSLAYYWGYWGYFNIDAVSYYGVQDLIKGFAYTLPSVITIGTILFLGNNLLDYILDIAREKFSKSTVSAITSIPFAIFIILSFTDTMPDIVGNWIGTAVLVMMILTLIEGAFLGIKRHWNWAIDNTLSFFILKWLVSFGIISFLVSYSYGKHEAQSIIENQSFSYYKIKSDSDSTEFNSALKYLGKAGDYYFFISPDNKAKHIISIEKVPNLVLYNYDKTDSSSIHAYQNLVEKSLKHK